MPLSPKARGGIGGLSHTLTNSKILKKIKKNFKNLVVSK